jgi:hypothetical protein
MSVSVTVLRTDGDMVEVEYRGLQGKWVKYHSIKRLQMASVEGLTASQVAILLAIKSALETENSLSNKLDK